MEWTVVIVIVALAGLGASVVTPIVKLTNSITRLESAIDRLEEKVGELTDKNKDAHDRIFNSLRQHDERIDEVERRVIAIVSK